MVQDDARTLETAEPASRVSAPAAEAPAFARPDAPSAQAAPLWDQLRARWGLAAGARAASSRRIRGG